MNRQSIWSWRNTVRKSDLLPLTKLCCYVLADYMADAAKGCFPSIATLMKDTGLSNTSIAKHLRLVIEAGLLVRHRFRDRAGHCAGTNYYPRFPQSFDASGEEDPACLGAGTFFDVPEEADKIEVIPASAPKQRSPWTLFPGAKTLNEPSAQDEPQSVPALSPLTHNLPVELSNGKLLLQPQDEFQDGTGKREEPARPAGEVSGKDETEVAFLAWIEMAKKLAIPAYASQLTVSRRSLLQRTLSSEGGLQAWQALLKRLPQARFLLGQGKREFWISFEGLCSENIRVRLLEGAYDNVPSVPASAKPAAVAQVPLARWHDRIRTWVRSGKAALEAWPASWGPARGTPGCVVPEEALSGLAA